jgi:hypothetical protein
MTIKSTFTVRMTRTENIEVTVTDATEAEVWEQIICGWVDADGLTRAEYDELPAEKRAEFIAERAIALGMTDFVETVDEQLTLFDIEVA